jgi:hypothetical protein
LTREDKILTGMTENLRYLISKNINGVDTMTVTIEHKKEGVKIPPESIKAGITLKRLISIRYFISKYLIRISIIIFESPIFINGEKNTIFFSTADITRIPIPAIIL